MKQSSQKVLETIGAVDLTNSGKAEGRVSDRRVLLL